MVIEPSKQGSMYAPQSLARKGRLLTLSSKIKSRKFEFHGKIRQLSVHGQFPAEIPYAPKATMGAIDAGYVSQNVALICITLGLNNVPRMTMDTVSLKKALNLTDQQDLLLNQQIGYPKIIIRILSLESYF